MKCKVIIILSNCYIALQWALSCLNKMLKAWVNCGLNIVVLSCYWKIAEIIINNFNYSYMVNFFCNRKNYKSKSINSNTEGATDII